MGHKSDSARLACPQCGPRVARERQSEALPPIPGFESRTLIIDYLVWDGRRGEILERAFADETPSAWVEAISGLDLIDDNKVALVKNFVVDNRATPEVLSAAIRVLDQTLAAETYVVLKKVAKHRRLSPEDAIGFLDQKWPVMIRAAVVGNKALPDEYVAKAADDEHLYVRAAAYRRIGKLTKSMRDDLIRADDMSTLVDFIDSKDADAELVHMACASDHAVVREVAAKSPKVDLDDLVRLSDDSDALVRRAVIANPATPEHVLVRMADRQTNNDTLGSLARCPRLPREGVEVVLERALRKNLQGVLEGILERDDIDETILHTIAAEGSPRAVALAATSRHATTAVLRDIRSGRHGEDPMVSNACDEVYREWIERQFPQIHPSNGGAFEMLMSEWWTSKDVDPSQVELALLVCPNPV